MVYVEKVNTVDDALVRANDTNYGAERVRRRPVRHGFGTLRVVLRREQSILTTGMRGMVDGRCPLGGVKDSGMSRRHGAEGLLKYKESHTIVGDGMPVSARVSSAGNSMPPSWEGSRRRQNPAPEVALPGSRHSRAAHQVSRVALSLRRSPCPVAALVTAFSDA